MRSELLHFGARLAGLCLVLATTKAICTPPNPPGVSAGNTVVALGQRLFLDPRLSVDRSTSCSSCHQPGRAFSDGRPVSIGVDHHIGTRNTPSLLNVFDGEPLFWDGRRKQLDIAVLDPLVNRVEMGNPDIPEVLHKLHANANYRIAFAKAFPLDRQPLTVENLGKALATYIDSLPRLPSAFDRFNAGHAEALSLQAREGLRLFTGKAECGQCHDPIGGRFTDEKFHHSGVGFGEADAHLGELSEAVIRRNLPVAALGSAIGSNAELAALGHFLVSHQATDVGSFRTPSLRNVALTAPYMHDGSIKTLEAAVDTEIYYRGLATGRPIALTIEEQQDLLAFLRSLSSTASSYISPATPVPRSRTPASKP